jgi:hypothetical protein
VNHGASTSAILFVNRAPTVPSPTTPHAVQPFGVDAVFLDQQPLDFVGALAAEIDGFQRHLANKRVAARFRKSSTMELSTCPRNRTVEPG